MITKENIGTELQKQMTKYKVRAEYIALKLNMSFGAVIKWKDGDRVPAQPTIDRLNLIFKRAKAKEAL